MILIYIYFVSSWKSRSCGRTRASPHIKTYTRISPDWNQVVWFLMTRYVTITLGERKKQLICLVPRLPSLVEARRARSCGRVTAECRCLTVKNRASNFPPFTDGVQRRLGVRHPGFGKSSSRKLPSNMSCPYCVMVTLLFVALVSACFSLIGW